ncbi:MAG: hypothetical protein QMC78_04965 [Methanocellales archaeon]|nr:hypothetical protein [Methanocellales archaeon]
MKRIAELDDTKGALRVLLTLLREGPLSRTKLFEKAPIGMQATYTALEALEKLGLVKEDRSDGFPGTITNSLTEKGRRVAERVKEIENILNQDDVRCDSSG